MNIILACVHAEEAGSGSARSTEEEVKQKCKHGCCQMELICTATCRLLTAKVANNTKLLAS